MSTTITADNGTEIEVCHLGVGVVHAEGVAKLWARLSTDQRVELAAALDPGRRGLHVRLENQAATIATYRCERDAAVARAEKAEARTAPAVDRDVVEAELVEGLFRGFTAHQLTHRVCAAIESEATPDPDPVEVKAQELHKVASPPPHWKWDELEERSKEQYRRIARHVLGSGAEDE